MTFDYDYGNGNMFWQSDQNPYVPVGRRSWGEFRGFRDVTVHAGTAADENSSSTMHRFFTGMHGDHNRHRNPDGVARDSEVFPSGWLGEQTGHDWLAGRERESWTTARGGGPILSRHGRLFGWRATTGFGSAYQVDVSEERVERAGHRTKTRYFYDDHTWMRRLVEAWDLGAVDDDWVNVEGPSGPDHRCTSYRYTSSSDRFAAGLQHRVGVHGAFDCSSGLLTDTRSYYNGATVAATASPPPAGDPDQGNVTAVWQATGGGVIDGEDRPQPAVVTSTGYELGGFAGTPGWGRPVTVTDTAGTITRSTYESFAGGGLLAAGNHATAKVTTVRAPNTLAHTTISEFDRFWGHSWRTVDVAGRVTRMCRDALGRLASVYLPPQADKACGGYASARFWYLNEPVTPQHAAPVSSVPRWRIASRSLFSFPADDFHPANAANDPLYLESWEYLDGNGRVIETQRPSPTGGRIVQRTRYDTLGAVRRSSDPYHASGTPGANLVNTALGDVPVDRQTTFDPLGRPSATRTVIGGIIRRESTTSYEGRWSTATPMHQPGTTSPFGTTQTRIDARGELSRIVENNPDNNPPTIVTTYKRDPLGRLVEIADDHNRTTALTYNMLGWRTRLDDPNQGVTLTEFTPTGATRRSRDARGVTITSSYDVLSRLVTEHRGDVATPDQLLARYRYDGHGQVAGATGMLTATDSYQPHGVRAVTEEVADIDAAGRVTKRDVTVPAADDPTVPSDNVLDGPWRFTTRYGHDGSVVSSTLPGVPGSLAPTDVTETLTNRFNTLGGLRTVESSTATGYLIGNADQVGIGYDEVGRPQHVPLRGGGHHLDVDRVWQNDNRLGQIIGTVTSATHAGKRLAVHEYEYDAPGNPTSIRRITDLERGYGRNEYECFRYDGRQRLKRAFTAGNDPTCAVWDTEAPAAFHHWYDYDALTRFTSHAGRDYTYNTTVEGCNYGTRAPRPHAVTRIAAGNGKPAEVFSYNCVGAVTQRTVDDDTWDYGYDTRSQLTATTRNQQYTSRNTYTAGGQRIVRTDPDGTTTVYLGDQDIRHTADGQIQVARYYPHGSRRTYEGRFIHTIGNQQQSVTATIDANNGDSNQQRYHPYGTNRDGTIHNDRAFLDQTLDPAQQLTYLNARHYNHSDGFFQTIDPILDLARPSSLNPYTYAQGNPTTLADPTGLNPRMCAMSTTICNDRDGGNGDPGPPTPSPAPSPGSDPPPAPGASPPDDRRDWIFETTECDSLFMGCYQEPERPPDAGSFDFFWNVLKSLPPDPAACIDDFVSWACGIEVAGVAPGAKIPRALDAMDDANDWRRVVTGSSNATRYGDDVAEGIGDARTYIDLTRGGSIRNVGTNTTHIEFAENLNSGGWISRTSQDGAVQIFQRDGARYVLRERAGSYGGWTADFTPSGAQDVTLKIRLGSTP
jgi:RHS repeat-associated protein